MGVWDGIREQGGMEEWSTTQQMTSEAVWDSRWLRGYMAAWNGN